MALITLLDAQLAFGHVALLDHTDFSLEAGERVGLIGRNGAGKSSLLRILAGTERPDDGSLQRQTGLRVATVAQEPVFAADTRIYDAVSAGLAEVRNLIDRYSAGAGDLNALQGAIEADRDDGAAGMECAELLHFTAHPAGVGEGAAVGDDHQDARAGEVLQR